MEHTGCHTGIIPAMVANLHDDVREELTNSVGHQGSKEAAYAQQPL